jgi:tripeptidyl-peptidase I
LGLKKNISCAENREAKHIAAGKPVIDFANPVLYQYPEVMNDIVSGNAPACNTDGFSAVPG